MSTPNWASVTYECVGDPKDIRLLHDALKYIDKRKTTIVPNGFGKWWLGNLVTRLGGNWEQYPCLGDITSYSLESETTLLIWQNTAWGEQEGVSGSITNVVFGPSFANARLRYTHSLIYGIISVH